MIIRTPTAQRHLKTNCHTLEMLSVSEISVPQDTEAEPRSGQRELQSIVSASFQKNTFGAAYFDPDSAQICILEDLPELDNTTVLSKRTHAVKSHH